MAIADDFILKVKISLGIDVNKVSSKLIDFLDNQIIAEKFDTGFKGHKLAQSTIKRKKRKNQPLKVGTATGNLRKIATRVDQWQTGSHRIGDFSLIGKKTKFTMPRYAVTVATNIGGELDFLSLEPNDRIEMRIFLKRQFDFLGYQGTGDFQYFEKEK